MIYPDNFRDHVRRLVSLVKCHINHHEYRAVMIWEDSPDKNDGVAGKTRAAISINHVYLWFELTIYPSTLRDWERQDFVSVGDTIVHEMCHLLVEPIWKLFDWDLSESQRQNARDTLERQVQRIANAIQKTMPEGWYLPKEA